MASLAIGVEPVSRVMEPLAIVEPEQEDMVKEVLNQITVLYSKHLDYTNRKNHKGPDTSGFGEAVKYYYGTNVMQFTSDMLSTPRGNSKTGIVYVQRLLCTASKSLNLEGDHPAYLGALDTITNHLKATIRN